MIASHESYFEDYVLQELLEASAWADYADGQTSKAAEALRSIAEKQEALGDEPTGIPARETLADLLLESKRPLGSNISFAGPAPCERAVGR